MQSQGMKSRIENKRKKQGVGEANIEKMEICKRIKDRTVEKDDLRGAWNEYFEQVIVHFVCFLMVLEGR